MLIKKIYNKIRLFCYSFIYSLSGINKITDSSTSDTGIEISEKKDIGGSVFSDMLEEKKTQQVIETVDAYYRIYKESNKFDTSSIKMTGNEEDGFTFIVDKLKKKSKIDFMKHHPVFNPDELKIRTIQDNKHLENKYDTSTLLYNYETTLNVFRDNFTPRFKIEKIIKQIVVRELNDSKCLVDLYVPSEASQFGKIDAIVISNLYNLMNDKKYKSDLVDFIGFEWVSDKGWNTEDVCLFKYTVNELIGINKFDGSIVLTYICDIINDGIDLTEKYKTKSLDEKYKIEAPKREDIDIFTYQRKIERDKNKEINLDNLTNNKITII